MGSRREAEDAYEAWQNANPCAERKTRVVVNIARHETCEYVFDGVLDEDEAREAIESGEHDPAWSKIRQEDLDVVRLEVEVA